LSFNVADNFYLRYNNVIKCEVENQGFFGKTMSTKYLNAPKGEGNLVVSFCVIFGIPVILIIIAILMGKF